MADPETPQQLLERIRRQEHAPVKKHRAFFRSKMRELFPHVPLPDDLEVEDFAQYQFQVLLKRLPDSLKRKLQSAEDFWIGEIHRLEFNGQVALAPNGGALVFIHSGLFTFIYKICRALATRMVAVDDAGNPLDSPTVEFDKTVRIIATTFAWLRKTKGIPYGADFPVSGQQRMMAHQLATYAEWFVFCHEIAHVELGHLEGDVQTEQLDGVELVRKRHEEEFQADARALELLLDATATDFTAEARDRHLGMAWAGAFLYLSVEAMLARYGRAVPSETHPPATERVERLRAHLFRVCSDEAEFRRVDQRASALQDYLLAIEWHLERRDES